MTDSFTTRVHPETVTLERVLAATPSRVFQAWADPRQRRLWDVPDDGWVIVEHEQDFRVGGREYRRFGPRDDPGFHNEGRYLVIETDRLIVSSGVMHHAGIATTATLCTVEISTHRDGTLLTIIDQSVYLGPETPAQRTGGWTQTLQRLADELGRGTSTE